MTLLGDLKELVSKYEESSKFPYRTVQGDFPIEWAHFPVDQEEGRRVILDSLKHRRGWPIFVTQAWTATVYFDCGPITKYKSNPNGYMHSTRSINFVDIIYAIVDKQV